MESAYGTVKSAWKIVDGMFHLDIEVPEDGIADVYMPFSDHAETISGGKHHFEEPIGHRQR